MAGKIEREIQARVEFKMNEFLTAVRNTAKANWGIAFNNMSQKHEYYWEAFKQMEDMFNKELMMATPYDEMAEKNRKDARDEAVNVISESILKRGTPEYHNKTSVIANAIERAQNY